MTPEQRANLQSNIDKLDAMDAATGGWTSKLNARQKGFTLSATWQNKIDVFDTIKYVEIIEQAPALLNDAMRKLLDVPDANSERNVAMDIIGRIEAQGIDYERLNGCLERGDNWGDMVSAVEFLIVLSAVRDAMKPKESTT